MKGVSHVATKYRTERSSPPRESVLARLAGSQHGVVALPQLRDLGLSSSAVRSRVASGKLHRVHRGVYALGHPLLSARGRWTAAVLACGPHAVLSHRSAAALWGIRPTAAAAIDVTAPHGATRGRAGIKLHQSATLRAQDLTTVDRIPCTTVARTLLDLAEVMDRRGLERAYEQAEVLRILDTEAVEEAMAATSVGRRGASTLRAVAGEAHTGATLTRSELEERFLAMCDAAEVSRPQVNAWVPLDDGGVEVDFVWPAQRLVVETDGYRVHGTRRAFERDRRRDARLLLAGWRVARFTWRQLVHDPAEVGATIRALLAGGTPERRGWDSNPRGS